MVCAYAPPRAMLDENGACIGPFVACNWAVGTFVMISLGTWCVSERVRANCAALMMPLQDALSEVFDG